MDPRQLHKRLFDAVERVIPAGGTVVCAVSGGVDSVAMLHGLVAVNEIHERGWRLHVAHLDHGMRDESSGDLEFVRQMAESLGLGISTEAIDVRGLAQRDGLTVEEAGRKARHAFIEGVALGIGASTICLAHHADDQAETVLHHVARGTGLRGLAGMNMKRPVRPGSGISLVRPMLGFRRVELEGYVASRGLAWKHDHTNDETTAATRNLIRLEVMPHLERTLNPEIQTALVRLATQARRAQEALDELAREALRHIRVEESGSSIKLPVGALSALPVAVQGEIVILALERLRISRKEIGFERMEAILGLVAGDSHKRQIELPGGSRVMRQGKWLTISGAVANGVPAEAESVNEQGAAPA